MFNLSVEIRGGGSREAIHGHLGWKLMKKSK